VLLIDRRRKLGEAGGGAQGGGAESGGAQTPSSPGDTV